MSFSYSWRRYYVRARKMLGENIKILLTAVAVAAAVWALSSALSAFRLKQTALELNEQVASSFRRDFSDIRKIVGGQAPSEDFIDQIQAEIASKVLLRYKIFDASGILRFDTDVPNFQIPGGSSLAVHNSVAAENARSGRPFTKLAEGRNAIIAETYLPVLVDGKIVAVQEFYVDQTQKMGRLKTEFSVTLFFAVLLAALAFGIPALAWRRKSRVLEQKDKELDRAQRFLNALVENMPAAVLVKDAKTKRYLIANKAIADIHVVPREDFIGRRTSDFFSPDMAAKIEAADEKALQTATAATQVKETIIETPGRGDRMISSKRVRVLDATGTPAWLITILEDVTELRQAENRIKFLAHNDPLTGLANRAHFQSSLETSFTEAQSSGSKLALLLFDLDGFKEINDTFGHAAGDVVLKVVGQRIAGFLNPGDAAARLGGDEYAVLMHNVGDDDAMNDLMRRVFDEVQRPIEFETRRLEIQLSAGISFLEGDCPDTATWLRQADLALYEAKNSGKGVHCIYLAEIMERRIRRKALEIDLHSAIERKEFELHYQPIVSLASGRIVSMEALLRWHHPERGLVSPVEFIPIAEETGLIVPIGEIVLEKACREAVKWPAEVRISVNLSPIQFRDRSLALKVAKILMQTGLPPSRLELEITEAALLDDSFDNMQLLDELRKTGIRIVMDDFGTGYSSLNYLRNFPFDKIKIDRSYVRDLNEGSNHSKTILNAVLAMADGLNLSTTAEGVETQEQWDILQRAGCTEMQGYFFSKPVPKAGVGELFEKNQRRKRSA